MKRRLALKQLTAVSLLALAGWMPSVHAAEDTIRSASCIPVRHDGDLGDLAQGRGADGDR